MTRCAASAWLWTKASMASRALHHPGQLLQGVEPVEARLVAQVDGPLADVHGEVPDALQIGDPLQRQRQEAQIRNVRLGAVDRVVERDRRAGQPRVALADRPNGVPDHLLDAAAHRQEAFAHLLRLGFELAVGVPLRRRLHALTRTCR